MYIKSIKWLEQSCKEAEVEILDSVYSIVCFSQPCTYSAGQTVNAPLECLSAEDIVLAHDEVFKAERVNNSFVYIICGQLIDKDGTVRVGDLLLHIESEQISGDISIGSYIEFRVGRIDLW